MKTNQDNKLSDKGWTPEYKYVSFRAHWYQAHLENAIPMTWMTARHRRREQQEWLSFFEVSFWLSPSSCLFPRSWENSQLIALDAVFHSLWFTCCIRQSHIEAQVSSVKKKKQKNPTWIKMCYLVTFQQFSFLKKISYKPRVFFFKSSLLKGNICHPWHTQFKLYNVIL